MLMNFLDPWPHQTIDNFYDGILFDDMKAEIVNYVKNNVREKFTKFDWIIENYSNDLPKTVECIKSNLVTEADLVHFPHHRKYNNLKLKTQIIVCIDDTEYRIHDEDKSKILSAVTYIAPSQATGTLLYDQNRNFVKEIEWAPNRTIIFAGVENVTWHNYKSTKNRIRITLNSFLVED